MCSIYGVFQISGELKPLREKALIQSRMLRHRGPDWSGIYQHPKAIMVHERLSIVDVNHGAQPLYNADRTVVLAVNGEIYNHRQLAEDLDQAYDFQTQSDCEIILALYQQEGVDFLDKLQGMYAFALFDEKRERFLIARDYMGIIPLYYGYDAEGQLYVASEMKALLDVCTQVKEFPAGHYWDSEVGEIRQWYTRDWMEYSAVESADCDINAIRVALETAVHDHLMTDVPYGVLLSGGLDSSIIAALAHKYMSRRIEDDEQSPAWWPQLHSFAVGLEGSPDLIAAQKVADHIGTIHHSMEFTIQEGLDALREVIWHLETFDVTTIRASTPMYLMARKIRAMGIKMVLSGEGADEIFGGYLYFHKAPDAKEFHQETVRKLDRLHLYDCLRANKSMAAWGVEARVPFLDKHFLDTAMRLNPQAKMIKPGGMEKQILREAFATLLPAEIVWRQKEQFSDGVGYGWIDALGDYAQAEISDQQFTSADHRFPENTPLSKEAYLYRQIFSEQFPLPSAVDCVPGGPTVACSSPEATLWDESLQNVNDPSGRAVKGVHEQSYQQHSVDKA
ncbi:MAG: asparagine synthase B [Xanthomonadales bacterium]|nr:asparagine synthase B [Xanthomonadales bacterium]